QGDDGDDVGVLEERHLRVVRDDEAEDLALAAGGDRVPLHRLAVGAHRARRMAQAAARGAVLDEELAPVDALPEEGVVLVARRLRARRLRLLLLRRLELEDAEAHGT